MLNLSILRIKEKCPWKCQKCLENTPSSEIDIDEFESLPTEGVIKGETRYPTLFNLKVEIKISIVN
jgi:hypothetical protein